jgi:hypothetical protein
MYHIHVLAYFVLPPPVCPDDICGRQQCVHTAVAYSTVVDTDSLALHFAHVAVQRYNRLLTFVLAMPPPHTFSIIILRLMTLSTKDLIVKFSISQRNSALALSVIIQVSHFLIGMLNVNIVCRYAECCCAECQYAECWFI